MLVGTLFVAVILDYVFIDEFGVVDEEAGHFFFEEFDAANIGIIFVCEWGLVAEIWAFAVIWLEFLFGGSNVVFSVASLALDLFFESDFHMIIMEIVWIKGKIRVNVFGICLW